MFLEAIKSHEVIELISDSEKETSEQKMGKICHGSKDHQKRASNTIQKNLILKSNWLVKDG